MKKKRLFLSIWATTILGCMVPLSSQAAGENPNTLDSYKFQDGSIYYSLVDAIGKVGTGASYNPQTKEYIAQFQGVSIKIRPMPTNEIKMNDQTVTLNKPIFMVKPKDQTFIFAPKELFDDAHINFTEGSLIDITKPTQQVPTAQTPAGMESQQQQPSVPQQVQQALTTPTPIGSDNSIHGTANAPVILVNGTPIQTDVPLIIQDGRTLVPLRAIFEALQGHVDWNGNTGMIDGKLGDREVVLFINSPLASVNGQTQTLDIPASLINGHTMVPLRFIAESLGSKVDWIADRYIINIIK